MQVIRPNIGGRQQGFSNVVIDCVLKLLLMSIFGLGYSLERDQTLDIIHTTYNYGCDFTLHFFLSCISTDFGLFCQIATIATWLTKRVCELDVATSLI